jgi:hypothetical protein
LTVLPSSFLAAMAGIGSVRLESFHGFGKAGLLFSHPFRKEREMDGAPNCFPTHFARARNGWGTQLLSHPFRKSAKWMGHPIVFPPISQEREMDGAPNCFPTQLLTLSLKTRSLKEVLLKPELSAPPHGSASGSQRPRPRVTPA